MSLKLAFLVYNVQSNSVFMTEQLFKGKEKKAIYFSVLGTNAALLLFFF